ncbi:hypothetical protein EV356DRAFT_225082 [Viridothelium virens]|uniref:Uncharacterized protein n=1 Tax=Viridothelium virens TaxID=1048519 RepID=A0A6A6HNC4_VIRVR|nr:hypothetical protein EV356DRAFT_225082 [Viridothelium virens]
MYLKVIRLTNHDTPVSTLPPPPDANHDRGNGLHSRVDSGIHSPQKQSIENPQAPVYQDVNLSQDFQRLDLGGQRQQPERRPLDGIANRYAEYIRYENDKNSDQNPVEHRGRKRMVARKPLNGFQHSAHDTSILNVQSQDASLASEGYLKDLRDPASFRKDHSQRLEGDHSKESRKTVSRPTSCDETARDEHKAAHSRSQPAQKIGMQDQSRHPLDKSKKRSLHVENTKSSPSLEGVVDLTDSEDTTLATRWAPAVTHETIHKDVHHIRKEHITREVHTHDYYHRILPVIDVQVLPPRHFVPSTTNSGQLVEVPGSAIPGRRDDEDQKMRNWFVARGVEKVDEAATGPRRFTARDFQDDEGDHHDWIGEDGVKRSTTTWVHAPTAETGGQRTRQTMPFHFGSTDPDQDGFRAEDFSAGCN